MQDQVEIRLEQEFHALYAAEKDMSTVVIYCNASNAKALVNQTMDYLAVCAGERVVNEIAMI